MKYFASQFAFVILLIPAVSCSPKSTIVESGDFIEWKHPVNKDTVVVNNIIRIAAVGDVMMGTENMLPEDGGIGSFSECSNYIEKVDIAILNLEGPLTDMGSPSKNIESESLYCFRTPPSYGRFLEEAGFDMVSLGNNHARDYGQIGLEQTIQVLEGHGISWAGAPGTLASICVDDVSVVMVAFSPYYSSNLISDIPAATEIVSELSSQYSIVIVSFHGGREGENAVNIPFETEYYYGENRGDVVRFSHAVVQAGADLVIGHGPHVPRALEIYQDRLIVYSLGNFCTGIGISSAGIRGYAPLLQVDLDKEGRFQGGRIVSFWQGYGLAPVIDPEDRAVELMHHLGMQFFPESNPVAINGTLQIPIP